MVFIIQDLNVWKHCRTLKDANSWSVCTSVAVQLQFNICRGFPALFEANDNPSQQLPEMVMLAFNTGKDIPENASMRITV